jgi:hypothetical protein
MATLRASSDEGQRNGPRPAWQRWHRERPAQVWRRRYRTPPCGTWPSARFTASIGALAALSAVSVRSTPAVGGQDAREGVEAAPGTRNALDRLAGPGRPLTDDQAHQSRALLDLAAEGVAWRGHQPVRRVGLRLAQQLQVALQVPVRVERADDHPTVSPVYVIAHMMVRPVRARPANPGPPVALFTQGFLGVSLRA